MPPLLGPADAGRALDLGAVKLRIRVSGEQTGGQFALLDLELAPGFRSGTHRHTRETETFLVRDGALTFEFDDRTTIAEADTVVVLPPHARHAFANLGPAPARATVLVTPAGLDAYFTDLHALVTSGGATEAVRDALDRLNERYGLDFSGR